MRWLLGLPSVLVQKAAGIQLYSSPICFSVGAFVFVYSRKHVLIERREKVQG
jgi:hypothetical protein